jgi:hypothetical protein
MNEYFMPLLTALVWCKAIALAAAGSMPDDEDSLGLESLLSFDEVLD